MRNFKNKFLILIISLFASFFLLGNLNVYAAANSYTASQVASMTNVTEVPIAGDESTEIKIFYKRESYKTTVLAGTGIASVDVTPSVASYETATDTFKYEAPLTLKATLKNGYQFKNWTSASGQSSLFTTTTNQTHTFTQPAGALTLTANATVIPYTVIYNLDGGEMSSKTTNYNVETATFNVVNPTKAGYIFDGWTVTNSDSSGWEVDTATKNLTVTKGTYGNLTFTANWTPHMVDYTINYYVKTFGNGAYELRDSVTRIGQATTSLTLAVFGDSYDSGLKYEYGMVDGSQVTTATIKEDGSLSIDLYFSRNAYTNPDGSVNEYEQEITISAPEKVGYTFTKWASSDTSLLPDSTENPYTYKQPAGSISFTAVYTPNEHEIVYELEDGEGGTNSPTIGVYDTVLIIDNPTKPGYEFLGWDISGMDDVTHTIGSMETTESSVNGVKDTSFLNLRSTNGIVIFKANWQIRPYYFVDDTSNQGVTFEDGVEYHIGEDVVLNPTVSDGWFLYPIDEKHPNAIQVKLSETDEFITYTEGLKWKDSDIIVKAETEAESILDVKSDELRKWFIENGYLPYHIKGNGTISNEIIVDSNVNGDINWIEPINSELEIVDPYRNPISEYNFYTIDNDWLADLAGQIFDLGGLQITNLSGLLEFRATYNCEFINYLIVINQEVVDQYTSFEDLVDDLADLGVSDIYIKDVDMTHLGNLVIKDGITNITFDNCITKDIIVDETNTTIENVIITNNTTVDGKLSVDNDVIQNVTVENSIVNDTFHVDSDSVTITTTNSNFKENADITVKDTNYVDTGSVFEKDLTITITGEGDASLTDTIVKGNLTINGKNSDVVLEDVTVEGNAEIKVVEGNISTTDTIVGENLTIETNNGNVDTSNTDVEGTVDVHIKNNGDVILDEESHIKGDFNVTIENQGDVTIDNSIIDGSVNITIGSGDVTINGTEIGNDLNVKVETDGNITITDTTVGGNTSLDVGNNGDILIEGSEFTGDVSTNIAGNGSTTITDTIIHGKLDVDVNNGNIILEDVIVKDDADLTVNGDGNVSLKDTTVGGNLDIEIKGNGNVTLDNVTVEGTTNIEIGGDGNVTIKDSHLHDTNIHIGGNGDVNIDNTIIDGDLNIDIDGEGDVTITDSHIKGDVYIEVEGPSTIIIDKTIIDGDLTIKGENIEKVEITDSEIKGDVVIDRTEEVDLGGTTIGGTITINGVKILDLSNRHMKDEDLVKLELATRFPQLEALDISKNELTEIKKDVLPSILNYLNASQNLLEKVDFSGLTYLNVLDLHSNFLEEVDVSANANLNELNLSDNLLTQVDLTTNTQLESVDLSYNSIAAIDLSYMNSYTSLSSVLLEQQTVYATIPYGTTSFDLKSLDKNFDISKVNNVTYFEEAMSINANVDETKPNSITYEDGKVTFEHTDSLGIVYYEYDAGLVIDGEKQIMTVNVVLTVGTQNNSTQSSFRWDYKNMNSQGLRISVINKNTLETVYVEDFSNAAHDRYIYFGYNNKLGYTVDSNLVKLYDYTNTVPKLEIPAIIHGNSADIMEYVSSDYMLGYISNAMNIKLDALTNGMYDIMVEPVAYFRFKNKKYAATATELALFDLQNEGRIKKMVPNLSHKLLPNALVLDHDALSYSKIVLENKQESHTSERIIKELGFNILSFKNTMSNVSGDTVEENVIVRTDTTMYLTSYIASDADRITALGTQVNVRFVTPFGTLKTTVDVPTNEKQLAYVEWKTPSEKGIYPIEVYADDYLVDSFTVDVRNYDGLESPDTNADDKKPKNWKLASYGNAKDSNTKRWSIWEAREIEVGEYQRKWELVDGEWVDNGGYEKKWSFYDKDGTPFINHYSVTLSSQTKLAVDSTINNTKTLKSGRGVEVKTINTITGNGIHTEAQTGVSMYSEYGFKTYYDDMIGSDVMTFPESPYSYANAKVHYTPIWYPNNTKYVVRVRVLDVWTPGGMVTSDTYAYLTVNGSMWDDIAVTGGR